MTDSLQPESSVEMTSLGVQKEMFLIVVKHVSSLGNFLLLCILVHLTIVEIRRFEPVSDLDIVKIGRNKNTSVVHGVLVEPGYHLLSEVFEPGLDTLGEAV